MSEPKSPSLSAPTRDELDAMLSHNVGWVRCDGSAPFPFDNVRAALDALYSRLAVLEEDGRQAWTALEAIAMRAGPFKRDPLAFAQSVIESMGTTADEALAARASSAPRNPENPETVAQENATHE